MQPERAVAGSYGVPPQGARLHDATRLGGVVLQVADLARSVAYYERVLGLHVHARSANEAVLTAHGDPRPLVTLRERKGAVAHPPRGRLGLFHFAILLPDRPSLARFVRQLGTIGVHPGAGDHLVSEAFYLTDPDGLGIEIYADRPRATWMRRGRELAMGTDPVDIDSLLADAGDVPWTGMPAGTVMGHVHLHVGDLDQTRSFYSELLGFDVTVWSYPSALFLAAGGYHHHLGTNLWAGPSATPPGESEAQLLEWTILLPDAASVAAVSDRLNGAGHKPLREGDSILVRDPWKTPVRISLGG